MKTMIFFTLGAAAVTLVLYLIAPTTVSQFFGRFPAFDSTTAGLWMAYLNSVVAASAYTYVFPNTPRSQKSLIGGGLFAASSFGLTIAVLYSLPYSHEHVDARYFILLELGIYAFFVGIPLAVVELREAESKEPVSEALSRAEFRRQVTVLVTDAVVKLQGAAVDAVPLKRLLGLLQGTEPDTVLDAKTLDDALACLHGHASVLTQYEKFKSLLEKSKA